MVGRARRLRAEDTAYRLLSREYRTPIRMSRRRSTGLAGAHAGPAALVPATRRPLVRRTDRGLRHALRRPRERGPNERHTRAAWRRYLVLPSLAPASRVRH